MKIKVAKPPLDKSLMIYDGDCHFCSRWILRWKKITGNTIHYTTSQEAGGRFPEIPAQKFSDAVCLITMQGDVVFGAEAVYQSLALSGSRFFTFVYKVYQNFIPFKWASELMYRQVAKHRMFFSSIERNIIGLAPPTMTYHHSASLFRIILAGIFLIAFLSAGSQMLGLIGSHGIYPIERVAEGILSSRTPLEAFKQFPSLMLFNTSDTFLMAHCVIGVVLSVFAILGILQSISFALLWACYLSLSVAGGVFFAFQWDTLLLECAFLLIFMSPTRFRISRHLDYDPPGLGIWLFRWLLFRLVFASGYLKLASGDFEWTHLTAMTHHYYTQPLPSVIAWGMQQFPTAFHKMSTCAVLGIEIIFPILLFLGKRAERLGLIGILFLMTLIILTGSYSFFNLLTIGICLLLWGTARVKEPSKGCAIYPNSTPKKQGTIKSYGKQIVFGILFFMSSVIFFQQVGWMEPMVQPIYKKIAGIHPFRMLNRYGLFINMTTQRDELVIEGSNDLRVWKEYEFYFKPGDVTRIPLWNTPHQPRLDWQMWFASLGTMKKNSWLASLMNQLLENEPSVTKFFKINPFENAPPRFIRVVRYEYRFSQWTQLLESGNWWIRTGGLAYSPIISKQDRSVALKKTTR